MPVIRPMLRGRRRAVHELERRHLRGSSPTPRRAAGAAPRPGAGARPLPPPRAHRPGRRVGGRGRARARGVRAGAAARGRVGPLAARRASRPAVDRRRPRDPGASARVRRRRPRADHPVLAPTRARCARTRGSGSRCTRPCGGSGRRAASARPPPSGGAARTTSRSPRPSTATCAAPRTGRTSAPGWRCSRRCWSRPSAATRSSATDGELRVLAAFDDDAARDLLRAALVRAGEREVTVPWITSTQQWAVDVCLEAGLEAAHGLGRGVRRRRRRARSRPTSRAAPSCESCSTMTRACRPCRRRP